jgi:hypothetical protein
VSAPRDAISFLSYRSSPPFRFTTTSLRDAAVIALGEVGDNSQPVLAALKIELDKRKDWPNPIRRLPDGFGSRGGLFERDQPAGKYPGPEIPESYSAGLVSDVLKRLEPGP